MNKKYWFVFLAVLMPGLVVAQAPRSDLLPGKFDFRIGAQAFTTTSTTIRIDSATLGLGTEFTLEDATNLEETSRLLGWTANIDSRTNTV